ncbi:MAG: flagellar hook-length control protein FliK, partial [Proteobacteria bacterium]|nr:flagellar hook-length control protein FliK [Pseudomonadota bacterium]
SISMNIVASASEHGALSRDLFSDLGQELAAFDVKTTQYAPTNVGASMNSMEEQLAAAGFRVQTSELAYGAQGTKSGTANNHNTILEHSLTWNPELNSEVFSRDLKNDSASQPANRADQARELVILGQERNYLNTMGEQVSSIVVAAPDYSKSFSQNSSSFQDNLSEQESNGEEKAAVFDPRVSAANGSLTGALGSIKEQGFVSTLSEAAGPQEPKSGDIHNKILQHASLLLKDGGGSMRMDIHTPNLGKIDLAINLNNNQLDVRILTASDQSRDMINRELTGLRDGLGQQGISLRTVEIGNANQSSQHFGGNTFAQGRQGQQTSYNEMKEYSKSFANTFTSSRESLSMPKAPEFRGQIPSSWMNSAHASSRIAVRI